MPFITWVYVFICPGFFVVYLCMDIHICFIYVNLFDKSFDFARFNEY